MPGAKIESISIGAVSSGEAPVHVRLSGGGRAAFRAVEFDRPEQRLLTSASSYWAAHAVVHVSSINRRTVQAAVAAMSADLGGYWLRYYRNAKWPRATVGLGSASLRVDAPGVGVVETQLKDGRRFSLLAAEPSWWKPQLEKRGLLFYFGPAVLFLARLDEQSAQLAAENLSLIDDQLFCRLDTPRRTLIDVLDDFAAIRRRD
jgi:hypothetical protein